MRDYVRESLKGVGQSQRSILLWLGQQQGVTSVTELKDRWPSTTIVRKSASPDIASILSQMAVVSGLVGEERTVPSEYAPFLEESYFYGASNPPESEGWVRWRPESVLGNKPSNSQSSTISTALRKLEDRGLVELLKMKGKGRRVSHARLTFQGQVASVLLRLGGEKKS